MSQHTRDLTPGTEALERSLHDALESWHEGFRRTKLIIDEGAENEQYEVATRREIRHLEDQIFGFRQTIQELEDKIHDSENKIRDSEDNIHQVEDKIRGLQYDMAKRSGRHKSNMESILDDYIPLSESDLGPNDTEAMSEGRATTPDDNTRDGNTEDTPNAGPAGSPEAIPEDDRSRSSSTRRGRKRPQTDSTLDSTSDEPAPRKKLKNRALKAPIQFAHLFQVTELVKRYYIIEHPQGKATWYILHCDEHAMPFSSPDPLQCATEHLSSANHYNGADVDVEDVIRELGIEVLNCNTMLAKWNNDYLRCPSGLPSEATSPQRDCGQDQEQPQDDEHEEGHWKGPEEWQEEEGQEEEGQEEERQEEEGQEEERQEEERRQEEEMQVEERRQEEEMQEEERQDVGYEDGQETRREEEQEWEQGRGPEREEAEDLDQRSERRPEHNQEQLQEQEREPETDQEHPTGNMGSPGPDRPEVGRLYRVPHGRRAKTYVAMHLPFGPLNEVGILGQFSIERSKDKRKLSPKCYVYAGKEVTGWAEGYEDGGPHEAQRKYLVIYFDDKMKIPLNGQFLLPRRDVLGWAEAKDFQPFDFDDYSCKKAIGYATARIYRARMSTMTGCMPWKAINHETCDPSHESNQTGAGARSISEANWSRGDADGSGIPEGRADRIDGPWSERSTARGPEISFPQSPPPQQYSDQPPPSVAYPGASRSVQQTSQREHHERLPPILPSNAMRYTPAASDSRNSPPPGHQQYRGMGSTSNISLPPMRSPFFDADLSYPQPDGASQEPHGTTTLPSISFPWPPTQQYRQLPQREAWPCPSPPAMPPRLGPEARRWY